MIRDRNKLKPGKQVVGSDMKNIGVIAEVRDEDMLVTRRDAGDIYVPFDNIQNSGATQVVLDVRADDIDLKNWPRPATAGTVGAVESDPGPAGTGMPFGKPGGLPTFMDTGSDKDKPAASNLISDSDAGMPDTPTGNVLRGNARVDWDEEGQSPRIDSDQDTEARAARPRDRVEVTDEDLDDDDVERVSRSGPRLVDEGIVTDETDEPRS